MKREINYRMQKSNKYFISILRTFIVVVSIVITVTSVVIYTYCRNAILEQSYSANMQLLERSKKDMEDMYLQAHNIASQIYGDRNMAYSLYGTKFDPYKVRESVVQLMNYRLTVPHIDSIYLYNSLTKHISVNAADHGNAEIDPFLADGEFGDTEIADIIKSITKYDRRFPIARVIPVKKAYEEEKRPCYTFFFYEGMSNTTVPSIVFVNFSSDFITTSVLEKKDTTLIVDNRGMVVSDFADSMGMDVSQKPYIKRILESNGNSGSFISEVENEKTLVSFIKAADSKWSYVQTVKYSELIDPINNILKICVLLVVSMILLGGIAAIISAKRLAIPMKNISDSLEDVESKYRGIRFLHKQHTLVYLLSGGRLSNEKFSTLNLQKSIKTVYRLLEIQIDQYRSFCENNDQEERSLDRYAIMNIASEICGELFSVESVELNEGRGMIIILSGESEAMVENDIAILAQHLINSVRKYLNISVSIIVGRIFNDHEQISLFYKQITDCAFNTVYGNNGSVLYVEEIVADRGKNYVYPLESEELLCSYILSGNVEKAKEVLKTLINSEDEYPYSVMNLISSQLTLILSNLIHTLKKNLGDNSGKVTALDSAFRLESMESINEMQLFFEEKIGEICRYLAERKNSKHTDIAERINEIIRTNYGDMNLCLDEIARQIGMSAPYIGRIYKRSSTKGVAEYLNEVRMEAAKYLLRNERKLTIAEISQRSGFASSSYFSRTFKKENGITPNEYRSKTPEEKKENFLLS